MTVRIANPATPAISRATIARRFHGSKPMSWLDIRNEASAHPSPSRMAALMTSWMAFHARHSEARRAARVGILPRADSPNRAACISRAGCAIS